MLNARYDGEMKPTPGETVADALGTILQRDFRSGLYDRLTAGLHDAVDPTVYPILSGIDRFGASSAASIGEQIGLDRSVVSRRASRLRAAGLITAAPDPADARATLLCLTTAGEAIVREMRRRLATTIDGHLSTWPAADRRTFASLLERFTANGPLAG